MIEKRISNQSQAGAIHIFGLIGMALIVMAVVVLYSHWQTVRRLDDQVKQLSSKVESLATKIKVLELKVGL